MSYIPKHITVGKVCKTNNFSFAKWWKMKNPHMSCKKIAISGYSSGGGVGRSNDSDTSDGINHVNHDGGTEHTTPNCLGEPTSSRTPNSTCGDLSSEVILRKYDRILLIEKYTKYDNLRKKGFKDDYILRNFFSVYISHFTHTLIVNNIINLLRTKYRSHVSILKAYKRNIENICISSSSIFSPDAIFSVGGDGTYLESAHIIANKYIVDDNSGGTKKHIELVGINSDPRGSEGKLCLEYFHVDEENEINYTYESFEEFEQIYKKKKKKKNFVFTDVSNFIRNLKEREEKENMMRTDNSDKYQMGESYLKDENTMDRIAQNNSLRYECVDINEHNSVTDERVGEGNDHTDDTVKMAQSVQLGKTSQADPDNCADEPCSNPFIALVPTGHGRLDNLIISAEEYARNTLKCFFETNRHRKLQRKYITVYIKRCNEEEGKTYRSINEVYIYEAIKNNICTYINIDNKIVKKLKSTGLLITSGTGSTAWAYNVNKIDKKKMKNIIDEFVRIQNDVVKENIQPINYDIFSEYINNSICFHPSSKHMKCIVKEPVENSVYDSTDHVYDCQYVNIRTCTSNTIVYIDGIYNIKIQPNDSVILHIKEDDFIVSYK
ncbi:conserved Plasmodium protein, unknown function [Plasmodium knowlesi strain H]|uniref:NAD(+) kinase n=3 Tax=Plasmodium knowlesi TaxID=5850 RepID=A0A5K1UKS6_PLAKH|nr:conserved protein, unknown function [Plasmodium knowlesi strain H]OTN67256.1 Uncharacterized protein PKNOH_S06412700 [Plasmodium knowlesi]CAA9987403.1 conserved protein, unknown function [Plasmodium knowlesi strain H]SBO23297.1 conserved Plasmodium protein, unknown function [Plasmodium knowlesi strain H]SBO24333.1 conserved Plasmodium protein, unknown function [Plasmodium knowlesi strain H]VVS76877.1 conserved protein, unknown function [Plasmodium knowlesi strain H]|eukprot:XP_002258405.1 hypothetical protein, conserved in Plasmodium species [Plasmodium knowlesi strain H]